jgi:anti-anti-sigma factor
MKIQSKEKGDTKIISLTGKLVGTETNAICKALEGLENSEFSKIVIDLSRVGFIDSYGLGCLIDLHQMFKDVGKKVVLAGPRESVLKLFQNSLLVEIFEIVDSNEAI